MLCMLIWCQGMFSSASTWMYNVALTLMEHAYGVDNVAAGFVTYSHELEQLLAYPHAVVKTHEISGEAYGIVSHCATLAIVTTRNPRDAVASFHVAGLPFDMALSMVHNSAIVSRDVLHSFPRVRHYRYNCRFFQNPHTVKYLAKHLRVDVSPAITKHVFTKFQRSSVESYIASMNVDTDVRTHWHKLHAGRSGEIGRWKHELSNQQVAEVDAAFIGLHF